PICRRRRWGLRIRWRSGSLSARDVSAARLDACTEAHRGSSARSVVRRSSNGWENALGDVVDVTEAVDLAQQSAAAVDVGQRLGLLLVDVEPVTDDVLAVVAAAFGLGTGQKPGDDLVRVRGELDDVVDGLVLGCEHAVELFDLGGGAGVAVEEEAVLGIVLAQTIGDHGIRHLVGHVLAGVHIAFGELAQFGLPLHIRTEDVSGRDRGYAERLGEASGLGALTRAGRADQDDACAHGVSFQWLSAVRQRPVVISAAGPRSGAAASARRSA